MSTLPELLYAPAQVRELDRRAIEEQGIPGYSLMTRAGTFAYRLIRDRWGSRKLVVVCGAGNNAGDGYVIARLALADGISAEVIFLVEPDRLKGDAARAAADYGKAGGRWRPFDGDLPDNALIVDALLGTGLDRPVSGQFADAVEAINRNTGPVMAVDVPSGLNAETGAVMGAAVRADVTATFVGMKSGLL
ncbi:MAG: NAD(P)H-hydrate epimerase, partial [Gammaproteobacteria bacterium]